MQHKALILPRMNFKNYPNYFQISNQKNTILELIKQPLRRWLTASLSPKWNGLACLTWVHNLHEIPMKQRWELLKHLMELNTRSGIILHFLCFTFMLGSCPTISMLRTYSYPYTCHDMGTSQIFRSPCNTKHQYCQKWILKN